MCSGAPKCQRLAHYFPCPDAGAQGTVPTLAHFEGYYGQSCPLFLLTLEPSPMLDRGSVPETVVGCREDEHSARCPALSQGSVSDCCCRCVQLARSGQWQRVTQFPSMSSCLLPGCSSWPGSFFCEILVPQLWTSMYHQFQNIMK